MVINDMLKTYCYTRNKLNHFNISIFNPFTDNWITIKHPTADEYIYLCDRNIVDWTINAEEEDTIDITVYMLPDDQEIFSKYYK